MYAARFSCPQSWNRPREPSSRRAGSRCDRAGPGRRDPFAHVDRRSATKWLGAINAVTALGVEFEVGRERLIGQQANFRAPALKGATLDMVEQEAPEAPALLLRRNRNVLDPQMVRPQDRLGEAGKRAVNDQKVDRVLGDRAL